MSTSSKKRKFSRKHDTHTHKHTHIRYWCDRFQGGECDTPPRKQAKRECESEWRLRMERQIADQRELLGVLRGEMQWEHHKRVSRETRQLKADLKKTKRALHRSARWLRRSWQTNATLRAELTALQRKMLEWTSEEEGDQDVGDQDAGDQDAGQATEKK